MQIKVVKAATMKEAMEQVKRELGIDAVILHTKKYHEGGLFGYHSKEMVEVTAAIEDEDEKKENARQNLASSALKADNPSSKLDIKLPPIATNPIAPPSSVLSKYKTSGTDEGIKIAENNNISMVAPIFTPPAATPPKETPVPSPKNDNDSKVPDKQEEEKAMQADENTSSTEDAEKIKKLEAELSQMKTLLAQVMVKDQPKDKVTMQEILTRQEVDAAIIKDMAGKMSAGATLLDVADTNAQQELTDYLADSVKFSEGLTLNKHGVRIVALIGATGVGKTTTLAKIAARMVLEKNIRAALITADTYRISAVEQLKTYSDIIGLPLEIVYTPDELKVALHKHRDKDLILLDTAGRSQHNDYQMQELENFLAVAPYIEKHLVMSATTKYRDAAEILNKFSVCKPTRVIFTKTDETSSVGLILNILKDKDIALSFLTNGQSVPDDIIPANAESLAKLLLRE